MYFWKDDFALMIKAQNPEEAVGFFGPGIKGDGAYRYITIPFTILYPTFGLNPMPYFFVGVLMYFLATVFIFFLAVEIFDDRLRAFLTALIFSSGYIGADSIFGLTNSYQTSWVIILLALCLIYFIRSFKTGYIGFYCLSVFLFFLSLETGYIRAHGFFLIVVSSLTLVLLPYSWKKIPEVIFKIAPFFMIFNIFYLNSTPAQVGNSQLTKSLNSGDYNYFYNPLITLINVLIPTPLINYALKLSNDISGKQTGPVKFQILLLAIFLTLYSWIFISLLIKKHFKPNKNIKLLLISLFSVGTIIGSFVGVFYIGAAASYLESTHRYLSAALIGLSFFWVSLFSLIFSGKNNESKLLVIAVIVICLTYLELGNTYAVQGIDLRTAPQKEFFSQLKNEIPEIKEKTFLYFDVSNKNNSNGKFGNIFGAGSVGGSAEITMHYPGVDRYSVVTSISDFQDFVKKYQKENGNINNSYWFYFENNKLINKTMQFRNNLEIGKITPLILNGPLEHLTKLSTNENINKNYTSMIFTFPENIESLTDGILKFNLQIIPEDNSGITNTAKKNNDEIYLEYLLSKSEIKQSSTAKTFSHFQNYKAENMFDSKLETSWMANRGPWHNIINGITSQVQFIEISLNKPIMLGGILFTNGHNLRTPTKYKILLKENNNWKEIKIIDRPGEKQSNEIWFDKLDPKIVSEVRLELLDSSSHDAPQIAEIELVVSDFTNIDFKKAQEIEANPSLLSSQNFDPQLIKNYFARNGKLSFIYQSDKDNEFNVPTINFDIKGLNEIHKYEIPIPASGTHLIRGKFFNLNYPARYIFSDFEHTSPPLKYYLDRI